MDGPYYCYTVAVLKASICFVIVGVIISQVALSLNDYFQFNLVCLTGDSKKTITR